MIHLSTDLDGCVVTGDAFAFIRKFICKCLLYFDIRVAGAMIWNWEAAEKQDCPDCIQE